jgi:hypothetical protein
VDPVSELGAQRCKKEEREDLECQASDHGVDPRVFALKSGRPAGNGAAGRLQKQRYEVERYERDGVGARFEAGKTFSKDDDDSRQAKVDGCGEEGGSDGEGYEVPTPPASYSLVRVEVQLRLSRGSKEFSRRWLILGGEITLGTVDP